MKFGKQLRLKAVRAWIPYYVDYEHLKLIIYPQAESSLLDVDACAGSGTDREGVGHVEGGVGGKTRNSTAADNESDDSVGDTPRHSKAERAAARMAAVLERAGGGEAARAKAADAFISAAEKELAKAADFFNKTLLSDAALLVEKAVIAEAAALAEVDALSAEPASASRHAASSTSAIKTPKRGELSNVAPGPALTPLKTTALSPLEAPPKAVSEAVENAEKALAAARTIALDASGLIDDMRVFCSLNLNAIEKAAKKFDKRWSALLPDARAYSISPRSAAVIAASTFADGSAHAGISALAGRLTQTLPPPKDPAAPPTPRSVRHFASDDDGREGATVKALDIASLPINAITNLRIRMAKGALDEAVSVPVIVARGAHPGPVLGITSALHGNELAGIPVIHRLLAELDTEQLRGTVVAVPVMNPIGFARYTRGFSDGADLNRIMPGKKGGSAAQSFAFALMHRLVARMDFLLDLHTASFGRVNSLYVRADMNDERTHRLALLQAPQIVVHNTGPDGSLRGACAALGKPAITIEIGNPQVLNENLTDTALRGVRNTMAHLNMVRDTVRIDAAAPVVCSRSFWIFSRTGGILTVKPAVAAWVRRGDVIAEVHSVWGALIDAIPAPVDGVVVGKSTNPVCQSGDRIIHLGVVEDTFGKCADDGH